MEKNNLKNMKKAAVLFTGGKDSMLALLKAKQQGYDVKYLLSIIPTSSDSYMFHKPSLKLLKIQGKMLGLPIIIQKSRAKKEEEINDLKKLLLKVKNKINYLVIGGIASNYQAKRIINVANGLGIKVINPLWKYSPEKLWNELLKNGFEVIITKISCGGLPSNFLGKIIRKKEFLELKKLSQKYKFDLSFEGGDAETAVLYCPLFKKKIRIIKSKIRNEGPYRHFLIIGKIY